MTRSIAATLPVHATITPVAAAAAPRVATQPLQTVTALPAPVNLEIYKGDDFYLDVTVTNPDGSDADLSAVTPAAQIRPQPNSATILATFDLTVDGNVIHLHLPHGESHNLIPRCAWDVQITGGDITTLAAGTVTVSGEVTMP